MYTKSPRKRVADLALVLSAVAVVAWGLTGCSTPEEKAKKANAPISSNKSKKPAKAKTAAPTKWGDGTYKVGVEIPLGSYYTTGNEDGCYWERLSGDSGELDDVIANDTVSGRGKMSIQKGDKFVKFSLGCDWFQDR